MSLNYASIKNKTFCTGYEISQNNENTIIHFKFEDTGTELNGEVLGLLYNTLESGRKRIIIDLSSSDFPSFKIWGNLLEFYKTLEKHNGKLCIIWNPEHKLTLYHITRLSKLFKIYPDLKTAVKHIN